MVDGEWETMSRTGLEPAPCFTGPITAGQKCHDFRRVEVGRSQEVAMKAKANVPNAELKVWCAQCCIRIARNEERTVFNGKTYHTRCYSKLQPTGSKPKA